MEGERDNGSSVETTASLCMIFCVRKNFPPGMVFYPVSLSREKNEFLNGLIHVSTCDGIAIMKNINSEVY